jgi:hypothetical protein
VLRAVTWDLHPVWPRDFYFWSRCYEFFGKDSTVLINKTISRYNYFGVLYTIKKKVLFFDFEYRINNATLAKTYFLLADMKYRVKKYLSK